MTGWSITNVLLVVLPLLFLPNVYSLEDSCTLVRDVRDKYEFVFRNSAVYSHYFVQVSISSLKEENSSHLTINDGETLEDCCLRTTLDNYPRNKVYFPDYFMGLRVFYKLTTNEEDMITSIEKRQVRAEEMVVPVNGNEDPIISALNEFETTFEKEILSVKASILLLESIDFNVTLESNENWGDYCLDALVTSPLNTPFDVTWIENKDNKTLGEVSKTIEKINTNANQDATDPTIITPETKLPSKFRGIRVFYRVVPRNADAVVTSVQPTINPSSGNYLLDRIKNLNFVERSLAFGAVGLVCMLTLGTCIAVRASRSKKISRLFSAKKGYSRVEEFALAENNNNTNNNNNNSPNNHNDHNDINERKDYLPINFKGATISISSPEVVPLNYPVTAPIPPLKPPSHMHFASEIESPVCSPKRFSRK